MLSGKKNNCLLGFVATKIFISGLFGGMIYVRHLIFRIVMETLLTVFFFFLKIMHAFLMRKNQHHEI